MKCHQCSHFIVDQESGCSNCGADLKVEHSSIKNYLPKYPINFQMGHSVDSQIRTQFFKLLESEVEIYFGGKAYRLYFDQFYKTEFYKHFDLRVIQLAEKILSFQNEGENQLYKDIDQLLDIDFYAFIDHFFVVYCKNLHHLNLPEAILKYSNVSLGKVDFQEMILDYLDFENEPDKVYTELLIIPPDKIKNAVNSFLKASAQEHIFFICDQTLFGSCKEGFAMTDSAMYWRSHFNEAQSIKYADLGEVEKEAEWIKINDQFFNVNKQMNFKVMYLLRKIMRILSL